MVANKIDSSFQRGPLILSTIAFTICFSVWTLFSIIGLQLRLDLELNATEFGLLLGLPALTGSLIRGLVGILADRYGGRIIFFLLMIASALATWLLALVETYEMFLVAGLGVGVAGGSFAVGMAYVFRWYPVELQGRAASFFTLGNMGAGLTLLIAPLIMVEFGWEFVAKIWAAVIAVMAVVFLLAAKEDPSQKNRRLDTAARQTFADLLEPLQKQQVWRFSFYYFFLFGSFLAISLWLPAYYMDVYGVGFKTAGILAALFAVPVAIFRLTGGSLADKFGARKIMYWTFGVTLVCTFILSYPPTDYVVHGAQGDIRFSMAMGPFPFALVMLVFGAFLGFGMSAVYKHIPSYYPDHQGAVGGIVGMVGGLGGFLLPILFGVLNDMTGVSTTIFMLLFALAVISSLWMHFSIRRMEERLAPELATLPQDLPTLAEADFVLEQWEPEDTTFWESTGRAVARRNLWISIPALFLAFAVWMVWSVVVVNLPKIGFSYSANQLFWLAALPGLSGATLRVFYSFMVPIFGGRRWTTLSTASLLLPALGIGFAVQNPQTPYTVMMIFALFCGFGGGNFASSMSNISFFYPQREKGTAMGLNAGLGNLGVSGVQLAVPLVITAGIFGAVGGQPQQIISGETVQDLWIQNAGFIWVPFIVATVIASWFGMNDIASARASFKEQSVIFKRKHNWLMCWIYTGTFGSFIGYSAGLPLLIKFQFPEIDPVKFAFLGPLVGALLRPVGGLMADKLGGARVTFWNFVVMTAAVIGVLYYLPNGENTGNFWGFLGMFIVLFATTGIGNGSTFRMIPVIFMNERQRAAAKVANADPNQTRRDALKESAAVIGFSSAIAAYGAFFIPKSFGTSIGLTGGIEAALYVFITFYLVCIGLTWWYYSRKGAEAPC